MEFDKYKFRIFYNTMNSLATAVTIADPTTKTVDKFSFKTEDLDESIYPRESMLEVKDAFSSYMAFVSLGYKRAPIDWYQKGDNKNDTVQP